MAMGKCAAKRGFFVLRDCHNLAMNNCNQCLRPVCGDHYLMRGNGLVCHDCNVRQQQFTDDERLELIARDGAQNRLGFHAYRHSYYVDGDGYSPFYLGYYYDRYYDAYDARAFDKRHVDDFLGDDDGFGFTDS